jgi:hypothetical protein
MTDDSQAQVLKFIQQNPCSSTAEIANGLRLKTGVVASALRALYGVDKITGCDEEGRHQAAKKYFDTVPVKPLER